MRKIKREKDRQRMRKTEIERKTDTETDKRHGQRYMPIEKQANMKEKERDRRK